MSTTAPPPPSTAPPGSRPPDRSGFAVVNRCRLRWWEWGPPEAPPVLAVHGAADHGRMWDGLAPYLVGWGLRVVAIDIRGHGDSGRLSAGEVWNLVTLDLGLLARGLGPGPVGVIGHSFGGEQAAFAAAVFPEYFAWAVNLDGMGPPEDAFALPDLAEAASRTVESARRLVGRPPRVYASRAEMVERRAQVNPRLPRPWVEHLVEHGSRSAEGGWVWKLDPRFNLGLPGEFSVEHLAAEHALATRPLLVLTGAEPDTWSEISEEEVERRLAEMPTARHHRIEGAGHYVHIEKPEAVAGHIEDFLVDLGALNHPPTPLTPTSPASR